MARDEKVGVVEGVAVDGASVVADGGSEIALGQGPEGVGLHAGFDSGPAVVVGPTGPVAGVASNRNRGPRELMVATHFVEVVLPESVAAEEGWKDFTPQLVRLSIGEQLTGYLQSVTEHQYEDSGRSRWRVALQQESTLRVAAVFVNASIARSLEKFFEGSFIRLIGRATMEVVDRDSGEVREYLDVVLQAKTNRASG